MIKRILVALSGTPFTPTAVRYAIDLAKTHEATLTGVTIVDQERLESVGPVPIGGGAAAHALAEHRMTVTHERVEEEVAAFMSACAEAGIDAAVEREEGETLETLTDLWRYHDLTVFGLRGLFEYGVVDNPDDQVIRLIAKGVRPLVAVSEQHRPVRKVLVAYNGSMESAKAMKQFVQMRVWPSAAVRIVSFGLPSDEATPMLRDAADYCQRHGFETTIESASGEAVHELLPYADEHDADLIVMGSTARHKIFKFILGDTALNAMQHAETPLFLSQ